ncbi:hypothetical protein AXG93_1793s1030 [Marchantia polymorpha subsp. ruderalis]|uniref:Rad21/Rec8-like protein N-terminal domain-containing protein n=1 Tax=Marchantia polymorpha subsp. ruderalis TaxID=1480154 RepID=A0A176WHT1_MARPO|nr:hypothetical protein AXG93_1793s1030 [Marchantia polymorpha subsp. ruderalis]
MQAKLNRKKADQINIHEICMQVLQPQVPLALRLSGILMGGIVLIFDRKGKLQTALDTKARVDKYISLPREKLHARFETVTISYDYETFGDVERAMLHPGTPGKEEEFMDKEEYVMSTAVDPYQHLSSSGDKVSSDVPNNFQVSSEDITLEERNLSESLHQHYEDFGMNFQEDRIPPSDNFFMDHFFPEIHVTADIPTPPEVSSAPVHSERDLDSKAVHTEERSDNQADCNGTGPQHEGNQADCNGTSPQHEGNQAVELESAEVENKKHKLRKVRSAGARRVIFDRGYMEIPASVFEAWLRDSSDIRGRQFLVGIDPEVARTRRHLNLPSVCLLSPTCIQGLETFWPAKLANVWERTLTGNDAPPTEKVIEEPIPAVRQGEPVVPLDKNLRGSVQSSDPSNQSYTAASQDTSSPKAEDPTIDPEIAGDFTADFMEVNLKSAEREMDNGPGELRDFGSVEKLRTALQSPSAGSDDFWGNQFGLTPGQKQGYVRSDRSRSTPGSGILPLDMERDPPTGGSGRYLRESFKQLGPSSLGFKSLFQLSEGLRREEAARLFYQICVLASNHFLTVKQNTPYGDILLGRGIHL